MVEILGKILHNSELITYQGMANSVYTKYLVSPDYHYTYLVKLYPPAPQQCLEYIEWQQQRLSWV